MPPHDASRITHAPYRKSRWRREKTTKRKISHDPPAQTSVLEHSRDFVLSGLPASTLTLQSRPLNMFLKVTPHTHTNLPKSPSHLESTPNSSVRPTGLCEPEPASPDAIVSPSPECQPARCLPPHVTPEPVTQVARGGFSVKQTEWLNESFLLVVPLCVCVHACVHVCVNCRHS